MVGWHGKAQTQKEDHTALCLLSELLVRNLVAGRGESEQTLLINVPGN